MTRNHPGAIWSHLIRTKDMLVTQEIIRVSGVLCQEPGQTPAHIPWDLMPVGRTAFPLGAWEVLLWGRFAPALLLPALPAMLTPLAAAPGGRGTSEPQPPEVVPALFQSTRDSATCPCLCPPRVEMGARRRYFLPDGRADVLCQQLHPRLLGSRPVPRWPPGPSIPRVGWSYKPAAGSCPGNDQVMMLVEPHRVLGSGLSRVGVRIWGNGLVWGPWLLRTTCPG